VRQANQLSQVCVCVRISTMAFSTPTGRTLQLLYFLKKKTKKNFKVLVNSGMYNSNTLTPLAIDNHHGQTATNGHYTAVCRFKGKWWNCNDQTVKESESFMGKVHNKVSYVLLVQENFVPSATRLTRSGGSSSLLGGSPTNMTSRRTNSQGVLKSSRSGSRQRPQSRERRVSKDHYDHDHQQRRYNPQAHAQRNGHNSAQHKGNRQMQRNSSNHNGRQQPNARKSDAEQFVNVLAQFLVDFSQKNRFEKFQKDSHSHGFRKSNNNNNVSRAQKSSSSSGIEKGGEANLV